MTSNYAETLSALLDNESDDLELRRLCKALDNAYKNKEIDELLPKWQRYNLAQSLLHNELGNGLSNELNTVAATTGFSEKVMHAVHAEPAVNTVQAQNTVQTIQTIKSTSDRSRSVWPTGIAKVAVAASVAMVFTLFVFQGSTPESGNIPAISDVRTQPAIQNSLSADAFNALSSNDSVQLAGAESSQATVIDPVAQQRLRDYIDTMSFDVVDNPAGFQDFQDSPLLRLVNEQQASKSE